MQVPPSAWRIPSFSLVRFVLGALLLAAAIRKAKQQFVGVNPEHRLADSGWFMISVTTAELIIGGWLLSGRYLREAWFMSVLLFVGFACYSSVQIARRATSCGCFGDIQVNPRLMLLVDLIAVGLLMLNRPLSSAGRNARQVNHLSGHFQRFFTRPFWKPITTICLTEILVTVVGLALLASNDDTGLSMSADVVVMDPSDWIGKRFPLIEHVDVGSQLENGQWMVVLYHHDCPRCQSVIEAYRQSMTSAEYDRDLRMAVLELPPFEQNTDARSKDETFWIHGRMTGDRDWFVATPLSSRS
jgi:hypothetical protein